MKKLLSFIMTVLLVMPFFVGCADTGEESGEMPFGTEPGEQSEKRTETERKTEMNPEEELVFPFTPSDALTPDRDVNLTMKYLLSGADSLQAYTLDKVTTKINVLEKGVVTGDPDAAGNNREIVNQLIRDAGNNTALIFPEGTYYLDFTSEEPGIQIYQKTNFILHGENAKLINVSYDPKTVRDSSRYTVTNMFNASECDTITIEGFEIDYLAHTTADGIVTKIQNGYTYFTVYKEFVDKGVPISGGECVYAVNMFDKEGAPEDEYYRTDVDYRVEKDGTEPYSFKLMGTYGKVGQQISIRCSSSENTCPMFYFIQTKNISLCDITVRSCPSAIVILPTGTENFLAERLVVEPEEESQKLFATNVDSIHTVGIRGRLEVRNCRFVGLGDDALNVHSRVAVIASASGNTVSAKDGWTKSWLDDLWAVPGDTIEFYDKDYDMLGSAALVSFDRGDMELDSIPAGVDSTCFAINASCCPITVISDCVVSRGRARAFLLQTKNAAVVGCDISHLRLPAVIISPDFDTWFEGGFADNVILCNNTFADCCRASHTKNYGVILIAGCHDLKPVPKKGVIAHKNITVKDNMFIGCNSNAVYHHGAANVKFVGNLFAGCSGEVRSD